jgi:deoxyribodipyrimidine photo-lyase
MHSRSLLLLRRDLRLDDHPALAAAAASSPSLLIVWIDDPEDAERYGEGSASRWWLRRSLNALDTLLRARGQGIVVLRGPTRSTLEEFVRAEAVTDVYAHRRHEPLAVADEEALAETLPALGARVHLLPDAFLHEPGRILTAEGRPFRVFTPFWRQVEASLRDLPAPLPPPDRLPPPWTPRSGPLFLQGAEATKDPAWSRKFESLWIPGTEDARRRAEIFLSERAGRYAQMRDRLDVPATSGLSASLHFGELSARRLEFLARARAEHHPEERPGIDAFRRQLVWREFARDLLVHDPALVTEPFDRRYRDFPWTSDPERLAAWREGRLGVPLLDAAMHELWTTGTMHNRARMNVASFLTRMLNVHWRHGLAWFADTLLDADLANNLFGWQWSAGCGADAAPFVRLFNPELQAQRFDPEGRYLARYSAETPPGGGSSGPSPRPTIALPDRSTLRREALARYERWRARSLREGAPA